MIGFKLISKNKPKNRPVIAIREVGTEFFLQWNIITLIKAQRALIIKAQK